MDELIGYLEKYDGKETAQTVRIMVPPPSTALGHRVAARAHSFGNKDELYG